RWQAGEDVELSLAGDGEVVVEEQVVVAMDRAADRVLERDHAVRRLLARDGIEDVFEALTRQRLGLRSAVLQRCRFAIRAWFSLICQSHSRAPSLRVQQDVHETA